MSAFEKLPTVDPDPELPMRDALNFMLDREQEAFATPNALSPRGLALLEDHWFSSQEPALCVEPGSPGSPASGEQHSVAVVLVDEIKQLQAEFARRQREIQRLQGELAEVDTKLSITESEADRAVIDVLDVPQCKMNDSLQYLAAGILDEDDCNSFIETLNLDHVDLMRSSGGIRTDRDHASSDTLESLLGRVRGLSKAGTDTKLLGIAEELQRQHKVLDEKIQAREGRTRSSTRSSITRLSIEVPVARSRSNTAS